MNAIGIYGGSFNPFHDGHKKVIENILNENILYKIFVIPCKQNPLKQKSDYLNDEERLIKIYSEIAHLDNVFVLQDELKRDSEVTYSWITIRDLKEKYPNKEFYLIIGSDEWNQFKLWRNWEWILNNVKVLVHPRKGYKPTWYDDNMIYLDNLGSLDISSTDIRNGKF